MESTVIEVPEAPPAIDITRVDVYLPINDRVVQMSPAGCITFYRWLREALIDSL